MKSLSRVLNAIDSITKWSGQGLSFMVYAGIAILFIEVVLRYGFGHPTIWAHGYSQRIFGSYFILIGTYTLLNKGHVRMDLLYNRVSLRRRLALDFGITVLVGMWCAILMWKGSLFFWSSFSVREVDEMVLAQPIYPIKLLIPIGGFLLLIQWLADLVRSTIIAIRGE